LPEPTPRAFRRRAIGRLSRTTGAVLVGVWLLVAPAWGADVRGRITLANGQPAAREPILLEGAVIGRTDVAGVYSLNLPAGTHTITVMGQAITIQVSPNGSRHDIKLK
jgi:hypothetical protein